LTSLNSLYNVFEGGEMRLSVIDIDKCVGYGLCMFACSRRFGETINSN